MFTASFLYSLIILACTSSGNSTTIHVPADYSTIQQGISAAASGDTVLVAPGTYLENIDFLSKAITVKSAEGPEVTCLDGGNPTDPVKRSTVTFMSGEGLDSILEGFEITNGKGYALYSWSPAHGGGIYCVDSSPTIRGNLIRGNRLLRLKESTYDPRGGGIYCKNSSPLIDGNIISGNQIFFGAVESGSGGGIYCVDAPVIITNNLIEDNVAASGGGIYINYIDSGESFITGNIIRDNFARSSGGGIYCYQAAVQVHNCVIHNNYGYVRGGAIYSGNWTAMNIINCTLVDNRAKWSGGLHGDGETALVNTILWNNQAESGSQIIVHDTVSLCYSDIEGGQEAIEISYGGILNWGAGMIDSDPLLNDVQENDLHLTGASPCIDAGDNSVAGLPGIDFEDNVRLFDGDGDGNAVVDMGADEILAFQVPGTYATIQDAIDAAVDQGVVCVAPGTYAENIDFSGKAIQVTANEGPSNTLLDGRRLGPVVSFENGEGNDSFLEGFSLTNGLAVNGGGIYCSGASPEIRENIIQGNQAYQSGGGIYCETASPRIHHNSLKANEAATGGGVAAVLGGTPELLANSLTSNTAISAGGGLYCLASSPEVLNCLISWNFAPSGGGIFAGPGASPVITHNTVYSNYALTTGGGLECGTEPLTVTNSIFWNNTASSGPQISGTQVAVTYSDIKGGWPGVGNLAADPKLFNPAMQDFRLTLNSPCLDQGDPNALSIPDQDFEGNERAHYSAPDMGMDEYWLGNRTLSVPDQYATIQRALDAAMDTDTVLVAPGTYNGCLRIDWKAVTLKGTGDPTLTVLDGQHAWSVISCRDTGETDFSIEGFTIQNGHTPYDGGGIYSWQSSPTIKGNIVSGNSADDFGGGLYFCDSLSLVQDNLISNNSAGRYGGGLYNSIIWSDESEYITLQDNVFSGNDADEDGGGASVYKCTVVNNLFIDNQSHNGGGIHAWGGTVSNNLICYNEASSRGGGIYCQGGNRAHTNNTIVGNTAGWRGGGVCCYDENIEILNSIIWGNTSAAGPSIALMEDGYHMKLTINYSVVEGGQPDIFMDSNTHLTYGITNLKDDPQLVNAANNNFHLLPNSPCIDAGTDAAANLPLLDMDGQPRIVSGNRCYVLGQPLPKGVVDIGADEYVGRKMKKTHSISCY